MAAAASALLLLLLLLLLVTAPPLSSAGFRLSPRNGKVVAQAVRSIIKKASKDFAQDKAEQGLEDFAGQISSSNDAHQLGSSAANSYGALTFDLAVGTSPRTLPMVFDITSGLIWAQCDPCPSCDRRTPPETPTFLSTGSSSFAPMYCQQQSCQLLFPGYKCGQASDWCRYKEEFHGNGMTDGYLAHEEFTFGTAGSWDMVFGCAADILIPNLAAAGASGFVGFSSAPLSIVSQLNISHFSFFIDNSGNGKSSLDWTWDDATPAAKGSRSTPLLTPTAGQNRYWYYVRLTGLEVNGQLLTAIPVGTLDVGGVFLSTTLPYTYLQEAAYNVLRQELVSGISVTPAADDPRHPNQLCYDTQDFDKATVPKLTLVFDGADASMELSVENYFLKLDEEGKTCLTILPSTGGSVLGSLLQAGRTMTYDIHGRQLTFETGTAGSSSSSTATAGASTAAGAPARAQAPLMTIIATLLVLVA